MFLRLQTQRYVRVYDLREQKLVKTLLTGVKWLSSMAVHPTGQSCWRHRFQPPKPRISSVFLCLCFELLTVAYFQHLLLIFLSFLALLIIIASVLLLQAQHKGRRRRACAKLSWRHVSCLIAGDHVIIGSYDCRLSCFDLELSSKPYKTLR